MKRLIRILPLALLLASCNAGWHQENKDAFFEACMDDAHNWIDDPSKAKTYCECVMIKVMEKYPNVNDALDNIELMSRDPEIQACRTPIMK